MFAGQARIIVLFGQIARIPVFLCISSTFPVFGKDFTQSASRGFGVITDAVVSVMVADLSLWPPRVHRSGKKQWGKIHD
jgi:hypothetical protein